MDEYFGLLDHHLHLFLLYLPAQLFYMPLELLYIYGLIRIKIHSVLLPALLLKPSLLRQILYPAVSLGRVRLLLLPRRDDIFKSLIIRGQYPFLNNFEARIHLRLYFNKCSRFQLLGKHIHRLHGYLLQHDGRGKRTSDVLPKFASTGQQLLLCFGVRALKPLLSASAPMDVELVGRDVDEILLIGGIEGLSLLSCHIQ